MSIKMMKPLHWGCKFSGSLSVKAVLPTKSTDFKQLTYFILLSVSLSTNEIWHNNCITQTTPWSPCSKTCGRGVSMRLSNNNPLCVMENESRLCNLRPCDVDITKHFRVKMNFICLVSHQLEGFFKGF